MLLGLLRAFLKKKTYYIRETFSQLPGIEHCYSPERIFYQFPLEESLNKLEISFILIHLSAALVSSSLVLVCNQ